MSEQNKIDEIKEALAAATPGPWELYEWVNDEGCAVYQSPVGMKTAITGWGSVLQTKENAQLIAKAPEYITYLLQEIERKDRYLERISVTFGEFECQRLAREAL